MSYLRGFSTNATCTGLTFALGYANQALIARGLGTHGRGVLTVISTAVLFGGIAFGEWLSRGNSYAVGRDPTRAGSTWANTGLYVLALCAALGGAAALVAAWPALRSAAGLAPGQLLLLAALVTAVVAQRGFLAILLGRDRVLPYALIPVLFIACYLAGNAAALGPLAAGVDGVLTSWLMASALAAAVALVLTRAPGPADGTALRATARVGARGAVSTALIFLLYRSDVFLVGWFLGAGPLGVYAIAIVMAEMMQRLPNVAGTVMLPKVLGGDDDDHALSLALSRWVLRFGLVAAAAIVAGGAQVIAWSFGAAFAGAWEPLVWMLPGLVVAGFASVLNTKLAGLGYPPVTVWAPAAAFAANVALNLLLIPRLGLRGAALATSIAYALWAALVTAEYRRRTHVAWVRFLCAP